MERIVNGITYRGSAHPNGGGFIREGVEVPEEVFVGPKAAILGGTILGGTILGGTILGGTIRGGTILGGTIEGGTILGGTILGGTILDGTILDGTILDGTILDGTILGGTILDGTILDGTILGGIIEGGTVSKNVTYICGATPYEVTITDTHCRVGCQWHTHDKWLSEGKEIMDDEKEGYGLKYMPLLAKMIKLHQES